MQRVQTKSRFTPPPTFARTDCRFGFQRRRVRLLACETLLPVDGVLPQISQVRAMVTPFEAGLGTTGLHGRQSAARGDDEAGPGQAIVRP